jgi:uncharacterized membrane protein YqiK
MYFCWPGLTNGVDIEDQPLVKALRKVGNPTDIKGLTNLFEETIFDAFRSAGGNRTWREITFDRAGFANEVLGVLRQDPSGSPTIEAALDNIRLVITHLELPEALRDAITKPEIARLNKEAAELDGEAEKIKLAKAGEGRAIARKAMLDAIGENVQVQSLLTLEQMAQGTSNTIFFLPSDIAAAFENIMRKGTDLAGILGGLGFDEEAVKKIIEALRSQGVK